MLSELTCLLFWSTQSLHYRVKSLSHKRFHNVKRVKHSLPNEGAVSVDLGNEAINETRGSGVKGASGKRNVCVVQVSKTKSVLPKSKALLVRAE